MTAIKATSLQEIDFTRFAEMQLIFCFRVDLSFFSKINASLRNLKGQKRNVAHNQVLIQWKIKVPNVVQEEYNAIRKERSC